MVFGTANFTSFVNAKPGEAYMRVRDLTSTRSFVAGSRLAGHDQRRRGLAWLRDLDPAGLHRAGAERGRAGPAAVHRPPGADPESLLFAERVVHKKSDPAHVAGTQFPADTHDTVAITELLDNWLDITGDHLDTTSGVTHVGSLDPSVKTRAWSGGWNWGNAMDSIAMLPAAIYYIRPELGLTKGTLCYVDVDQPTSPFGLSDVPDGTTTKGYREMEIVLDGTSLVNDFYAWGMGYGSSSPVFSHEEAPTSQANHGLWQQSVIAGGVYKQGTIDRIADSYVNGSPESKRGGKANRPYIRLTTYDPGLLAGHVVDFSSEVWGYSDAIPVRQLTLTFEAPDSPRYDITLSHEIDAPWSFIDKFVIKMPTVQVPHTPYPPIPTIGDPGPTTVCQCGITDGFDRIVPEVTHLSNSGTTTAPIGTSDSGSVWTGLNLGGGPYNLSNGGVGSSVDGASLVIRGIWSSATNLHGGAANYYLSITAAMDYTATKSYKFVMDNLPNGGNDVGMYISIPGGSSSGTLTPIVFVNTGFVTVLDSRIGMSFTTTADSTLIPNSWWVAGREYTVSLIDDGTDTTISITDGTDTYSFTKTGFTGDTIFNPALDVSWTTLGGVSATDSVSVHVYDLDIPEVNRGAQPFDDFNRIVVARLGHHAQWPVVDNRGNWRVGHGW